MQIRQIRGSNLLIGNQRHSHMRQLGQFCDIRTIILRRRGTQRRIGGK
jgi:hypothetical protein